MKTILRHLFLAAIAALFALTCQGEVKSKKFTTANAYLIVEVLTDNLAHFEASSAVPGPAAGQRLYTSPMILKSDYPGPGTFADNGMTLETASLRIAVNATTLAITITDKTHGNALLTTLRPEELDSPRKRLGIDRGAMQNVYGLGQQFARAGSADGDWVAHGVREGQNFGNYFQGFLGGAVGNVQIPVMYAVGPNNLNYALLFDNVYNQRWDFSGPAWESRTYGDQLRFYIMAGPDLPALRHSYMELTGTPPVPPRKAFGLWVSEFGYRDWDRINTLRTGLRSSGFPVDGFVLDLNWFGGVVPSDPSKSEMGHLNWDENNHDGNGYFFPDPAAHIKALADDHVGLAVIEESYLANVTDTFTQMPNDLTVFQPNSVTGSPVNPITTVSGFWGVGRMIDWSNPAAGQYIHANRRFPNLVKKGVSVHWTDLGEPETFDGNGGYNGVETVNGVRKNRHADVHNLYNLLWNQSIWNGYVSHKGEANDLGQTNARPFILARSGAAGSQRFGVAMWSGDIPSNLDALASHFNTQMHMSFSGIDYYGSDSGGFRRECVPYNNDAGNYRGYQEELFTQWFANSCWFDVPVRPHTDKEFKKVSPPYETAPNLVGKTESNLANLRQRYELLPYYYSLAYRAHLAGEPLMPPLVYYYQNDPNVRTLGHEKLIGRDLLTAVVARHGEYERDVYLPAGTWVDYHTNEWFHSTGTVVRNMPAYRNGLFRLPVFARRGAILPKMYVDESTMDSAGNRPAGSPAHGELVVQVYADPAPSTFTLYEDDGQTLDYDGQARPTYRYRTTLLTQQQNSAHSVKVAITPAALVGGPAAITGLTDSRRNLVRLVVENARAKSVTLNGTALPEQTSVTAFAAAPSGWRNSGPNLIEAKSDALGVGVEKLFTFALEDAAPTCSAAFVCVKGFTQPGESIYVAGNIPALGNFDPAKAVRLSPNVYYEYIWNPPAGHNGPGPSAPVWSGIVAQIAPSTTFEWKLLRKRDDGTGSPQWEQGPNHVFTTSASGYAGRGAGSL